MGYSADLIGILPSFQLAVAGGWGSVVYMAVRTDLHESIIPRKRKQ